MEFDWKKNWKWIAIGAGILLAIIVIAFLIVFLTGAGGIGIGKDYQRAGLEYHNIYRKNHSADPLVLNASLNALAEKCAKYYALELLTIDHSCKVKGIGENLYMTGLMPGQKLDPVEIVKNGVSAWYSEVQYANWDNIWDSSEGGGIGHFCQVVQLSSKQLGIGYCANTEKGLAVVVGTYYPPWTGEKEKDIRPPLYKS